MAEEKKLGDLGTAAVGANALNEAKKEPEHANKHKIEEEIGTAEATVGSGGVTFNEKKEANDQDEEARRKMLRNPFR